MMKRGKLFCAAALAAAAQRACFLGELFAAVTGVCFAVSVAEYGHPENIWSYAGTGWSYTGTLYKIRPELAGKFME